MANVWKTYGYADAAFNHEQRALPRTRATGGGGEMSGASLTYLVTVCLIFLTAASAMRGYVGQGAIWLLLASLGLYVIGNLIMIRIMREGGMAMAISITSVVQLILSTLVAALIFSERPTMMQWGGIALGVVAVAMIMWPSGRAG